MSGQRLYFDQHSSSEALMRALQQRGGRLTFGSISGEQIGGRGAARVLGFLTVAVRKAWVRVAAVHRGPAPAGGRDYGCAARRAVSRLWRRRRGGGRC
jgi:hypothetical protein